MGTGLDDSILRTWSTKEPEPTKWLVALDRAIRMLRSTLIARHDKYGLGGVAIVKHGRQGIIVRLSDKLARLENLDKVHALHSQDESVDDTFIDIAGYGIVGLMNERDWWGLPD